MKKYLITGISGFVGYYYLKYLNENEPGSIVLGLDLSPIKYDLKGFKNIIVNFCPVNMLDIDSLQIEMSKANPDYILHLASYSSVSQSWLKPAECFKNNTNIFIALAESIRKTGINPRILSIGSSEEYGIVSKESIPIKESTPLNPISPYAVARVAQEMMSKVYADSYKMDIVMTRSFNHIGAFQNEAFVVPSIIKKMVAIKNNQKSENIVFTGDPEIVRDFLDVEDVVHAYHKLFIKGKSGEIYNVCSGTGKSIRDIIEIVGKLINIEVIQKIDEKLIRPNDNQIIIGSNEKIVKDIGWKPSIKIEDSIRRMVSNAERSL